MPESQIQTFISATYSTENAMNIKRIRDSNLLPFSSFISSKYYKILGKNKSSDQAKGSESNKLMVASTSSFQSSHSLMV